ncbi:MAG: hypothetical protein KDK66_01020 [Deltaproteobacteria bacterium]|nr:hypothetical protein [Deltaproteobacteria bacterium]
MTAHTPNRLESHWEKLKPLIQKEWSALNEADLDYADKRFDVLVHLIRERCGGRTEIIQEAAIREKINQFLRILES